MLCNIKLGPFTNPITTLKPKFRGGGGWWWVRTLSSPPPPPPPTVSVHVTIGNIFTSGAATSENITDGIHEKYISIFHRKIFCLFFAFNPFWEEFYQNPEQLFSVISRGVPLPHSNALQYYVKREKCKVNDVIFPPSCEARAINLGNKNM